MAAFVRAELCQLSSDWGICDFRGASAEMAFVWVEVLSAACASQTSGFPSLCWFPTAQNTAESFLRSRCLGEEISSLWFCFRPGFPDSLDPAVHSDAQQQASESKVFQLRDGPVGRFVLERGLWRHYDVTRGWT